MRGSILPTKSSSLSEDLRTAQLSHCAKIGGFTPEPEKPRESVKKSQWSTVVSQGDFNENIVLLPWKGMRTSSWMLDKTKKSMEPRQRPFSRSNTPLERGSGIGFALRSIATS